MKISVTNNDRVALSLLVLRVSVFVAMSMWTVDKFIRPEHAASIYARFYALEGVGATAIYVIAAVEAIVLIGFVLGFASRFTYGTVLILHAISTFASYRQYLHPFENGNLLFLAAWPMLAACFALYYLRDLDSLWRVSIDWGSV